MAKVDKILAEMEAIGALGGRKSVAVPEVEIAKVEEVTVEKGDPGTTLKDLRGARMAGLLDSAIMQLGSLQQTFRELRDIWVTEEVAAGQSVDRAEIVLKHAKEQLGQVPRSAPARPKAVPATLTPADLIQQAPLPVPAPVAAQPSAPGEGWRGVDPLKRVDPVEEDDEDVPFVGQDRARPPAKQAEEVTVRSLGTRKVPVPGGG
jgi:hypothetical protein